MHLNIYFQALDLTSSLLSKKPQTIKTTADTLSRKEKCWLTYHPVGLITMEFTLQHAK